VKKTSEERHPGLEQIKRFVRGEASPAENRELVRHLLHGCPECQKVVHEYWPEEDAAAVRTNLDKGDTCHEKESDEEVKPFEGNGSEPRQTERGTRSLSSKRGRLLLVGHDLDRRLHR
jgi:predicted HD phosphohydrolase